MPEVASSPRGPKRNRAPVKRYAPYEPRGGVLATKKWRKESSSISDDEDAAERIKVSRTSDVKKVAGRIAHSMRRGELPVVLSTGASCVNQAVKASAIARKYLADDGIGMAIQPLVRNGRRCAVALQVMRAPLKKCIKHDVELTVSSQSVPSTVAGALAARVREGVPACVTGIGVDAIAKGIMAISNARSYLEDDFIDLTALPEFIHVEKAGEPLSALRLSIVAKNL